MVSASVVGGGVVNPNAHGILNALSQSEKSAAVSALSKLTGQSASAGVASVFGGALKAATLSGGSSNKSGVQVAGTHLLGGRGADTFVGGVHSGAKLPPASVGSDTVVAGSALSKTELTSKAGRALSADTINVAGTTAAGVKTAVDPKSTGHTITLADKTSITLHTTHNLIKPN